MARSAKGGPSEMGTAGLQRDECERGNATRGQAEARFTAQSASIRRHPNNFRLGCIPNTLLHSLRLTIELLNSRTPRRSFLKGHDPGQGSFMHGDIFMLTGIAADCVIIDIIGARGAIAFALLQPESLSQELCMARACFISKTVRRYPGDAVQHLDLSVITGLFSKTSARFDVNILQHGTLVKIQRSINAKCCKLVSVHHEGYPHSSWRTAHGGERPLVKPMLRGAAV